MWFVSFDCSLWLAFGFGSDSTTKLMNNWNKKKKIWIEQKLLNKKDRNGKLMEFRASFISILASWTAKSRVINGVFICRSLSHTTSLVFKCNLCVTHGNEAIEVQRSQHCWLRKCGNYPIVRWVTYKHTFDKMHYEIEWKHQAAFWLVNSNTHTQGWFFFGEWEWNWNWKTNLISKWKRT